MQSKYLTSLFWYTNPSRVSRSLGCWMWSESLSWHKTWSFIGGPTLYDTQLSFKVHRPLQELRIPNPKVMFVMTWLTSALLWNGEPSESRRQWSGKTKVKVGIFLAKKIIFFISYHFFGQKTDEGYRYLQVVLFHVFPCF